MTQQHMTDSHGRSPMKWLGMLGYVFAFLMLALAVIIGHRLYQQAPIADIVVQPTGLTQAERQSLANLLKQQQTDTFFATDLSAITKASEQLSWLDEVRVTRDWRQGIVVQALPKQPVARFGSERFVDAKGEVFTPLEERRLADEHWTTLQGDPSQAKSIMQQMQQVNSWFAPLNLTVEDMILTPRMTWLIRFDTGLRVVVDGENTTQKLMMLSQLLQTELHPRLNEMQVLDLRYKNGMAISWKVPTPLLKNNGNSSDESM